MTDKKTRNAASEPQLPTDVACRILKTPEWATVNDNVMGGISQGEFAQTESHLVFFGSINTNGGGFASVRHAITAEALVGADRIRLSIRSDGRAYKLVVRDKQSEARQLSHQAILPIFQTSGFETVEIRLDELSASYRGQSVSADPFDPANARSIGVILSDGVDGAFRLEIAWIAACGPID